jgi:hypothetical protein
MTAMQDEFSCVAMKNVSQHHTTCEFFIVKRERFSQVTNYSDEHKYFEINSAGDIDCAKCFVNLANNSTSRESSATLQSVKMPGRIILLFIDEYRALLANTCLPSR